MHFKGGIHLNIVSINPDIMWSKDLFLRQKSRDLKKEEVLNDDFKKIVDYMFRSLYENPIGVGLAAPQVGLMIKLVVIDIKRNGKNPLVLINPTYSPVGDEIIDSHETCLSFDQKQGTVRRYKKIRVYAKNTKFEDIEFETDTFLSAVCQHEIDHLNGIVYVDNTNELSWAKSYNVTLAEKAISQLYV